MAAHGMTEIRRCTCTHQYQDEKYGKGNRVCVCNVAKTKGSDGKRFVCTVCGKDAR